jgi:alkylation response protein AidB-like acyl-CoA dehydrogenase
MDFRDSPEEAAFLSEARAWLTANAPPRDPAEIEPGVFENWPTEAQMQAARAWQRRKFDAGWAGVFWPAEYGGRGGSIMQQIIWDQEERRVVTPPAVLLMGQGHVGYTLLAHGTTEQKGRWLPPTLRGELAWCQLFSEPGAGSDFAALACAAVRDGENWRIHGDKVWISDGAYADRGFLVTRTDPHGPKHKGLTCFVIDMRAAGVRVEDVRHPNGGSHFSHVCFDDMRVPDTDRVGAVDDGWRVALTTLMYERFFVGAWGSSGAFGGPQLRHLVELAKCRDVGGRPALEDSTVRQRLAAFGGLHREDGIRPPFPGDDQLRPGTDGSGRHAGGCRCALAGGVSGRFAREPVHAHRRRHRRNPAHHHRRAPPWPAAGNPCSA